MENLSTLSRKFVSERKAASNLETKIWKTTDIHLISVHFHLYLIYVIYILIN